jgi:hypothetical protein
MHSLFQGNGAKAAKWVLNRSGAFTQKAAPHNSACSVHTGVNALRVVPGKRKANRPGATGMESLSLDAPPRHKPAARRLCPVFVGAPVFDGAFDVGGLRPILRGFLCQCDEFSVGRET